MWQTHTHSHTHTPSSPWSPGILLSLLLFFSLLSCFFWHSHLFPLPKICQLQLFAMLPHTLAWSVWAHTPFRHLLLQVWSCCTRWSIHLTGSAHGRNHSQIWSCTRLSLSKMRPHEHLCALRELISLVSVLLPAAQVLFDSVLHHPDTLRFPWPDLLSALCVVYVAADVLTSSLFV